MKDTILYLLIGIAVVLMLIILYQLNRRDKKRFIDNLNRDYKRHDRHRDDKDPDDLKSD